MASELDLDKLHLKDSLRAKMGKSVVKFLQRELDRTGNVLWFNSINYSGTISLI